ncbi:hypothetical protein P5G50_04755 [Leifsonia sp. F6_8S_P_1B]|uniref:Nucleotidyl transferase AbiEii toxin, Type IV TA system n=1 Tax=Leifsonia williamsii TaxID=3035919 RepID=A0ABT8KB91_9MICO|nr:hypothetical protein [Leifsonia williamsii]MDN4613757.1 hypothetical protein [Leifsonia williamsii]
MAALTHQLNLGDDDQLAAWKTVIALSEVMDTRELTIVGGLMVYLHATRGGLTMPRSTDDADFLVNAMVHRGGLTDFAVAVGKLGFQLKDDEQFAYRFVHTDGRKIDAMVPDHLPSRINIRLQRKPALIVPAGQQAIDRRDEYQLSFNSGANVTVGVPDEIGALVAKGAAYLIDQRNPGRHLDDAATLLASITDASELDYSRSSKNDRARLRTIRDHIADETAAPWVNLDAAARAQGRMNLELVMTAMDVR